MEIENIRDQLKNFAEDYSVMQLSHKAYKWIWQMVESIDHDLENLEN